MVLPSGPADADDSPSFRQPSRHLELHHAWRRLGEAIDVIIAKRSRRDVHGRGLRHVPLRAASSSCGRGMASEARNDGGGERDFGLGVASFRPTSACLEAGCQLLLSAMKTFVVVVRVANCS